VEAIRLPATGRPASLRRPTGRDDAFFAALGSPRDFSTRVEVARRLLAFDAPDASWDPVVATDVDAALLMLHRRWAGDRIVAESWCESCGAAFDVTFSAGDYLAAHEPRTPRGIGSSAPPWFEATGARFRLPTVGDLLELTGGPRSPGDRASAIESACVEADSPAARTRALHAIGAMAPPLATSVQGTCPGCTRSVQAWFDPGEFVIEEIRARAQRVFEEVHLIASCYGWTEDVILDLPADRRVFYAERIEEDRRGS
jgi:hypothetical protein